MSGLNLAALLMGMWAVALLGTLWLARKKPVNDWYMTPKSPDTSMKLYGPLALGVLVVVALAIEFA